MHKMNLTTIELWDGSVVTGELRSANSTVDPRGTAVVTVKLDSPSLGWVIVDTKHITGMSFGKFRLENPGRETLLRAIYDRIDELRKGPLPREAERCPDYPGSPGVRAEFPGDTRETDRMLMSMYLDRLHIMESVLRNHEGKVACPALFHLECGDIIEEFRRAGIRVMENVDVLAAVQCFVARHLSEILPGAEWLQAYLDFGHREELGKLLGEYAG